MKRVGLVGGLGPESTIDYYRRILDEWQRETPGSAPSIVIDSLDVQQGIRLVTSDHPGLVEYLLESIGRLAAADADFVAITANTGHIVFDQLVPRASVPLLSIVEACAEEARRRAMQRVLLLGTRFTMTASFYPDVFSRYGITVAAPAEADQEWLHARYIGELLKGDFRDETREGVIALVERTRAEHDVEGVILGGTELPLLLRDTSFAVPALDTTAVHVRAIVRRLRDPVPL